jgi:cyclopropane-fatty-acyl-phospholipid synthase
MKGLANLSASLHQRLLAAMLRRAQHGMIRIAGPDGTSYEQQGPHDGPVAALHIRRWRALRRLIFGGALGFAESYLDGEWDTPELASVLRYGAVNLDTTNDSLPGSPWSRLKARLTHLAQPNTKTGAKRNIQRHYDLGNDFYRRWLDSTMTYSAAIFETPADELAKAQVNKFRCIANLLDLKPDHELLEIGCGWGGFARWAAKEIGCRITAITISPAQHDFAQRGVQSEGLGERVTVRQQDYRDVTERFDRIASIEMFEAVGERYWPVFFNQIFDRLKPGGVAALQIITIADEIFDSYRRKVDFIQRYVFPGGMLPSLAALRRQAKDAGLEWRADSGFAAHYALTLAQWRHRFEAVWPELRQLGFDERFRRMWNYYLAYCEVGFSLGRIDLKQVALARP